MKRLKYSFKSFLIILFLSILPLYSQDKNELTNYAETYQFEKLKEAIKKLDGEQKEEAATLYLKALLETDADKAIAMYNKILEMDAETINAERALWRIAQYYYIKGLYIQSADVLKRIIIHFPNSFYANKASEQLSIIRDEFGENIGISNIGKEEETTITESKLPEEQINQVEKQFIIQLGAFSSNKNALNRVDVLKKRGYNDIKIIEKVVAGRKLHLVWYGNFISESDAKEEGEDIKKNTGINYRIIEIN